MRSAEGDARKRGEVLHLELLGDDVALSAVLGVVCGGEVAVARGDEGAVGIDYKARIAGVGVAEFRDLADAAVVGVGKLDEHIALAVRAVFKILIVADPSHPAAGAEVVGREQSVLTGGDVAHSDDQLARDGVVFRLVALAGEFRRHRLRFAPGLALVC